MLNEMFSYTLSVTRLKRAHGALIKVMLTFERVNFNLINLFQMLTYVFIKAIFVPKLFFTHDTGKIVYTFCSFLMAFTVTMFCVHVLVLSNFIFTLKVALIALV